MITDNAYDDDDDDTKKSQLICNVTNVEFNSLNCLSFSQNKSFHGKLRELAGICSSQAVSYL